MSRTSSGDPSATEPLNEVRLRGRITFGPEERTLPSGDVLVSFRLAVPRDQGRSDALDCSVCSAATEGLTRVALDTGRHEVEVAQARRLVRAA